MFRGPSPGDPSPPRMQVPTHLIVHDSAFLDFGRWILAFLQSLGCAHSPESVCGMLDSVVLSSCCSDKLLILSIAADGAGETITTAAAKIAAAVVAIRQLALVSASGAVNRTTALFQFGCARAGIGGNGPFTWLIILKFWIRFWLYSALAFENRIIFLFFWIMCVDFWNAFLKIGVDPRVDMDGLNIIGWEEKG